jgi:hypothetical protein
MKEVSATIKLVKLTDARSEGKDVYQIDIECLIPKQFDFVAFDLRKLGPTAQIEGKIRELYDPATIRISVLGKPEIGQGDVIPVYFFENREIHPIERVMRMTTPHRPRLS